MSKQSKGGDSLFKFVSPLEDKGYVLRHLIETNPNLLVSYKQQVGTNYLTHQPIEVDNEESSCKRRTRRLNESNHQYISTDLTNETYNLSTNAVNNNPKAVQQEQRSMIYTINEKWDIPLIRGIHYDQDELQRYRLVGDEEMDTILALYEETLGYTKYNSCTNQDIHSVRARLQSFDIVAELERQYLTDQDPSNPVSHETYKAALQSFYQRYYDFKSTKDDDFIQSIDWESIQRGIDVFITYSPAVAMSLY